MNLYDATNRGLNLLQRLHRRSQRGKSEWKINRNALGKREDMKCYMLGYAILAAYLGGTHAAGLGFWDIETGARPLWLLGAVGSMVALALMVLRRRGGA